MNTISVLLPDADGHRHNVARCLKATGVVVVHGLALKYEDCVSDLELWLSRIGKFVTEQNIDVVLPTSAYAIRTLSEHRETLSWSAKLTHLPDPRTFDIANNKARLADFLAVHNLPRPPTVIVTAGSTAQDRLMKLQFPVLAKPPLRYSGIGIRRFDNPEQLAAFLSEQSDIECWVVQTFVEGHDINVNVLCQNGQIVASTVQYAIKPSSKPFRAATGIEFRDDPTAINLAKTLMRELSWSGVANIDMRFDAQCETPLILEINPRYWETLLGSANAAVNFPLLACELCLGELKSNREPRKARYFAGRKAALLSLMGGGKFRMRPSETNWQYFKPLPDALSSAKDAADVVRRWLSGWFSF